MAGGAGLARLGCRLESPASALRGPKEPCALDVVLFDIDGTLVDTGGAGRRAIGRAAEALHGRLDLFDGVPFDGATDRAICRSGLARLSRVFGESDIDGLLEAYLAMLADEVARSRYGVYPGVRECVAQFQQRGVLLGLGTGNVEQGARIKLARGDLNAPFPFGGFGSDAEDRALILRAGLARAAALLGRAPRDPWIVGDTPKDLAAGRAVGAKVVLVATGRYTAEQLAPYQPDLCVASLEDPRVLALGA